MNRHEWVRLEKEFESTGYSHFPKQAFPTCSDDYVKNQWDVPLGNQNPEVIRMLLCLNKRIEELEQELRKR